MAAVIVDVVQRDREHRPSWDEPVQGRFGISLRRPRSLGLSGHVVHGRRDIRALRNQRRTFGSRECLRQQEPGERYRESHNKRSARHAHLRKWWACPGTCDNSPDPRRGGGQVLSCPRLERGFSKMPAKGRDRIKPECPGKEPCRIHYPGQKHVTDVSIRSSLKSHRFMIIVRVWRRRF